MADTMGDSLWTALALVLVIEGLMPLVSPGGWRRMFQTVLAFNDGQLRFMGLCCVLLGLLALAGLSS
jgi:uncharacterized protein YjeT (DUF2065 family)